MNFKKWVKSIQTSGYIGAGTVLKLLKNATLQLQVFDIFEATEHTCLSFTQSWRNLWGRYSAVEIWPWLLLVDTLTLIQGSNQSGMLCPPNVLVPT